MRTCVCLKESKSTTTRHGEYIFKVNHKYSFVSRLENPDYFTKPDAYSFLVFISNGTYWYFTRNDFNECFIDLQKHRQNLINQILCEPVSVSKK